MFEEQPSDKNDFEEYDDAKRSGKFEDSDEFDDEQEQFSSLFLEILNEQDEAVDESKIRTVCEKILADADIVLGRIGIVLVDNETIHELNREFLSHDYPTDVISFQVETEPDRGLLEGEVIASVEMAKERAEEFHWSTEEELLLYVIHGLLHLVGYDDTEDEVRTLMREKEQFYLRFLGIEPNTDGFEEFTDD